jgi:hypothetical protein
LIIYLYIKNILVKKQKNNLKINQYIFL